MNLNDYSKIIHLSHNDLDGYGCQYLTNLLYKNVTFFNTSYFKTEKEKKVNQHLNIKHYYKIQLQVYRLEFVFLKRYFTGKNPMQVIERTIKNAIKKEFKFEDNLYLIS